MSNKRKLKITAASVLASSMFLAGCGLFGGDEKAGNDLKVPTDVSYQDDTENNDTTNNGDENVAADMVEREIYLIDNNGFVVSQSVMLPNTDSPAKQVLSYLVSGGPVDEMLPNGFRAVLPAGTEVDVNLKEDGTIVADFSDEFADYEPQDEMAILQAVTWTLTQFDNVEKVELRVNGHEQKFMPVNKTPINGSLSRADGINFDTTEVLDIMNTRPVTLYFLAESNDGETYYVPVTKRMKVSESNSYESIVKALIQGPAYTSGLVGDFNPQVTLMTEPKLENGNLTLNFNESILGSFEGDKIAKTVVDTLVLTLTEQPGVESISIMVNGEGELMATDGTNVSEPVSRPEKVNTGRF